MEMSQAARAEAGADKAAIADMIESWAAALRARDLDTLMACYARDVVAFDAITALRFVGIDAYRDHFAACLGSVAGEVFYEVHDLDIAVSGDLAVAHYLAVCGCSDETGEVQKGWMRVTLACRREAGTWRVFHEHSSMPFEPETGKALMHLTP